MIIFPANISSSVLCIFVIGRYFFSFFEYFWAIWDLLKFLDIFFVRFWYFIISFSEIDKLLSLTGFIINGSILFSIFKAFLYLAIKYNIISIIINIILSIAKYIFLFWNSNFIYFSVMLPALSMAVYFIVWVFLFKFISFIFNWTSPSMLSMAFAFSFTLSISFLSIINWSFFASIFGLSLSIIYSPLSNVWVFPSFNIAFIFILYLPVSLSDMFLWLFWATFWLFLYTSVVNVLTLLDGKKTTSTVLFVGDSILFMLNIPTSFIFTPYFPNISFRSSIPFDFILLYTLGIYL